jgi:hypothetical protein
VSEFANKLVEFARSKVGVPYIWAGRSDFYVVGGAIKPIADAGCPEAFDCAGLIDWAAWRAGANDLRWWWGADHLFKLLPEPGPDEVFRLRLYGTPQHAWHVALDLGDGTMLEAAGGDHTTLTADIAAAHNARVRIDPVRSFQFLGFRSVDALAAAPRVPPVLP